MKIKKILVTCFLALMLALTPLTMFACGKSKNTNVYKTFNDTFVRFKEDFEAFGSQTYFSTESKYYLNYLYSVNYNKEADVRYVLQNSISAYGLNFIEKYYPRLQDYKGKASLKAVSNSINSLNDEFDEMKGELRRLVALPVTANSVVYNGQFALYRVEFNDFVDEVYNTANALGDFLINAGFTESLGTETPKQEEFEIYADILALRSITDYQKFFFIGCDGLHLDSTDYNKASTQYSYLTQVFKRELKVLTAEEINELISIVEVVENSRKDYEKAIEGFSFNDYTNSFAGDMDAYLKEDENALAFYNKVCSYLYEPIGVSLLFRSYWASNVVEPN